MKATPLMITLKKWWNAGLRDQVPVRTRIDIEREAAGLAADIRAKKGK